MYYRDNNFSAKIRTAGKVLFAVAMMFSVSALSGTITKIIDNQNLPVISQNNGYSRISLAETAPFISPGKPILPHLRLNIELPEGADNVKITTTSDGEKTFLLSSPPEFAGKPATTDSTATRTVGQPDNAIYSVSEFFPATTAEINGIFTQKGKKIAAIRAFPVRVNPVSLEMTFTPSIRLDISFNEPSTSSIRKLPLRATPSDTSRTYLVITSGTLASAFAPLITEKNTAGISAKVVTVEDIYNQYSGNDAPAKIRACITDNYNNHGTKYVLLGGDASVVPTRMVHAEVTQDNTEIADIPCDLYYACLDGTWDSDGDGHYGEMTDGPNGGEIDLIPEVYVGRVPAVTISEVGNFLSKNSASSTRPNPESALLVGEYLGQSNLIHSYGGNALDTTQALLPGFDIDWLDDRPSTPQPAPSWSMQTISAALNSSPNIIAHSGHGTVTKTMGLPAANVRGLTNQHPFLITSIACHIGSFDKTEECFAKAMLVAPNAAFAAQMNTRQGWFVPGYEQAFSGEFMNYFLYYALLERLPLGEAHFKSKKEFLPSVNTPDISGDISAQIYRWCYLENTLFGDPLAIMNYPDPMAVTQLSFTNVISLAQNNLSSEFDFKVSNISPAPLEYAVISKPNFIEPLPPYPPLPGVSETNLSFKVDINTAQNLAPGNYTGQICFSNISTSATKTFEITLSVTQMSPVVITDTTMPYNDMLIDFGEVPAGMTRTEHVAISNTTDNALTVSRISSNGRELAKSQCPADFFGYDRTSKTFCRFSTDFTGINHVGQGLDIDAVDIAGNDSRYAYVLSTANRSFSRINLESLAITKVCDAITYPAGHQWGALAFNEHDGNFYAACVEAEESQKPITSFHIFPTNGAPQVILTSVKGNFNALAIDKSGVFYTINIADEKLYTFNPFTGEMTSVGNIGINAEFSQALDFDSSGNTLYWSANTLTEASIRILNTATAQSTTILELMPEPFQMFPPELELTVLPDFTPFTASGIPTPAQINSAKQKNLSISFNPVYEGAFTNFFAIYLAGDTSPLATVKCVGTAVSTGGIPAWWLSKFNLPLDGSATNSDPDHDGFTNLDEYHAGTSPIDAGSKLSISGFSPTGDGNFILTWNSIPGFNYSVERGTSLSATSFSSIAYVTATNTTTSLIVDTQATNEFFKIKR